MSWILFTLASYFLTAVSDVTDKVVRDKFVRNSYSLAILTGFLNLVMAALLVLIKPIALPATADIIFLLLSGIINVAAVTFYFEAMASNEASRVVPLFQFIAPFTFMLSFIFLGERLTSPQFIGFILLVLGGFLISIKKIRDVFSIDKGFWLMMLSCILYSISFVIIKNSLLTLDFYSAQPFISVGYFIGAILAIPIFLFLRKMKISDLHFSRPAITLHGLNQIIYVSARVLLNLSFSLAAVSLVTSIQGFVGVFVLILTTAISIFFPKILKEDISKSALGLKIVAIVLMFIGVWIIK
ncbi:MAG TPA: EamA family transporter [archaeon]|nr:EamA family transporter [archaeon]